MKNKKIIVLLLVLSLFQLVLPIAVISYERNFINTVIEKGEAYTLEYTRLININKERIRTNVGERYTVGYRLDEENAKEGELLHDVVDIYPEVGIEKSEDGSVSFFFIDDSGKWLTNYNWYRNRSAYSLNFSDYEFVSDEFGMQELFELCHFLCRDESKEADTFEEFMEDRDFLKFLYDVEFDGKITLRVYKGYAVISEFYIGDELILRHK